MKIFHKIQILYDNIGNNLVKGKRERSAKYR